MHNAVLTGYALDAIPRDLISSARSLVVEYPGEIMPERDVEVEWAFVRRSPESGAWDWTSELRVRGQVKTTVFASSRGLEAWSEMRDELEGWAGAASAAKM